jgi:hypothetical protein
VGAIGGRGDGLVVMHDGMTLTSGKIKLANDRQLFLLKNLKWHLAMPTSCPHQ